MRVTCIARRGETLSTDYLDPRIPRTTETNFHLTVGREYVVYAIGMWSHQIWYYIIDDTELWFPMAKPGPLFRVVDARVSRLWHFKQTKFCGDPGVLLAFEEWASDDRFYDRLSDQELVECKIFKQRKSEIDGESE